MRSGEKKAGGVEERKRTKGEVWRRRVGKKGNRHGRRGRVRKREGEGGVREAQGEGGKQ